MLVEAHGSREGGRGEYLSAPGREVATFGRRGGAGGFKLNYSVKTKKTTKAHDRNEHGDIQQKNTKWQDNSTGVIFVWSRLWACWWAEKKSLMPHLFIRRWNDHAPNGQYQTQSSSFFTCVCASCVAASLKCLSGCLGKEMCVLLQRYNTSCV